MADWFDGLGGNFLSLKMGETLDIEVKSIDRDSTCDPKFMPKSKDGTPQGWRVLITTPEGKKLGVGAYALQAELARAKVVAGDKIKLSHPKHGIYLVEKDGVAPF